jgi:hypothetical protein
MEPLYDSDEDIGDLSSTAQTSLSRPMADIQLSKLKDLIQDTRDNISKLEVPVI